jgi:hypothetical protein
MMKTRTKHQTSPLYQNRQLVVTKSRQGSISEDRLQSIDAVRNHTLSLSVSSLSHTHSRSLSLTLSLSHTHARKSKLSSISEDQFQLIDTASL